MLSISWLLDSNLAAIGTSMHLSAVSMLHKETSIFVGDRADVIFSDHHFRICDGIRLRGAGNGIHVPVHVVLEASALALVVCDNPFHRLLAKVRHNAVRVENFRVSVVQLPDDNTISCNQTVCLGKTIFALTRELSVVDLADFTRAQKLHDQAILERKCRQRYVILQKIVREKRVQVIHLFFHESRLWSLGYVHLRRRPRILCRLLLGKSRLIYFDGFFR